MRVWQADLAFHFANAARAVGLGLAAVAWASALSNEAQQNPDIRTAVQVAAAIVGVAISQFLTRLPPSATVVDLLQPFEKDILAVAREYARGDAEQMAFLVARIAARAAVHIRRGAVIPARAADRRAWLRALAQVDAD